MSNINNIKSICRFCLNVSTQEMQVLTEESDIMKKIRVSLRFQVQYIDKAFKEVCKLCTDEIEKVYQFHQKITESQYIILQYSNNGTSYIETKDLPLKLKSEFKEEIKTEINIALENKENDNKSIPIDDSADQDNIEPEIEDELTDNNSKSLENKSIEKDNNVITVSENVTNDSGPTIGLRKFKCLTCFEILPSQALLLSHYNKEHNRNPKQTVDKGDYKVVTLLEGETVFHCNICSKNYGSKKRITSHLALGHTNERPFLCKLCGRTYKTASEIIRHSRAHDGTRLFCSHKCGYSTVYPGTLREHEGRHNKTELKYKCEKCGKGFQVKTWYEQHQNVHSGLKPFVCDICGMAFHMDRYLTSHRTSVHPQSSDLKRYVCMHCSLPCDSRNSLTQHLKEHGINTNFLCDLCGKTLSNGRQLMAHKRMHLGVKPFSCSTCNKSFTKRGNLSLHERTHTGVKAFCCQQCGKIYSQRSTLLRHNRRQHSLPEKEKSSK